jgi:hypothetical protein
MGLFHSRVAASPQAAAPFDLRQMPQAPAPITTLPTTVPTASSANQGAGPGHVTSNQGRQREQELRQQLKELHRLQSDLEKKLEEHQEQQQDTSPSVTGDSPPLPVNMETEPAVAAGSGPTLDTAQEIGGGCAEACGELCCVLLEGLGGG